MSEIFGAIAVSASLIVGYMISETMDFCKAQQQEQERREAVKREQEFRKAVLCGMALNREQQKYMVQQSLASWKPIDFAEEV